MKKTKLTFALMAACTLLFACKKNKEESKPVDCPLTVESIAGSYRFATIEYKESPDAVAVDWMATMNDCEKQNTFLLNSNGTYVYRDGCEASESSRGGWRVKNNTITMDELLSATISAYDCKKLTYYVSNTLLDGDRMTVTLVKQ
ncbi:lipocalin family protein [Chitinophaga pendula]|uniref:lipocalin family protein n=1 Tax=Chitinophaga TaxID=79328 RepID=UPI0012FDBAEE|nr:MULTISPECIES: lipocalin family protein [Chitinophaga]UCJ04989.1 lipocalin family protein [Chitinophaga pendula]